VRVKVDPQMSCIDVTMSEDDEELSSLNTLYRDGLLPP